LSDPRWPNSWPRRRTSFLPAEIRNLAREIIGSETNPMLQAKAFYDWIGGNVFYSFAREYSTLTNISDYCLSHRYGDCGQEALLFITLCRSQGIPARWQTGWNTFPGFKDIHDWTEIYLAPYGWVPVDPWAGIFATRYCYRPDGTRSGGNCTTSISAGWISIAWRPTATTAGPLIRPRNPCAPMTWIFNAANWNGTAGTFILTTIPTRWTCGN
jgi:transglutaminase-like putative cysteine protease